MVKTGRARSCAAPLMRLLYQRCREPPPPPRYPPPPDPRSAFGRASLTFSVRPSTSLPLRPSIAAFPSESTLISTNAKPLACPVSRSVTMLTRSTPPYDSKIERMVLSVVPKLRLPTKIFFNLIFFLNLQSSEWARSDRGGLLDRALWEGAHIGRTRKYNFSVAQPGRCKNPKPGIIIVPAFFTHAARPRRIPFRESLCFPSTTSPCASAPASCLRTSPRTFLPGRRYAITGPNGAGKSTLHEDPDRRDRADQGLRHAARRSSASCARTSSRSTSSA